MHENISRKAKLRLALKPRLTAKLGAYLFAPPRRGDT